MTVRVRAAPLCHASSVILKVYEPALSRANLGPEKTCPVSAGGAYKDIRKKMPFAFEKLEGQSPAMVLHHKPTTNISGHLRMSVLSCVSPDGIADSLFLC